MNFELTDERRMLADTLRRFIAEQYSFERRERIAASAEGYSAALWQRFVELGAVGALFEEIDGGFGGSGFDIAVVFETIGGGLVLEPFLATLMSGTALALNSSGAHRDLLADILGGRVLAAFAHGEPGSRYEHARVATRARRVKGHWVLDGAKAVVRHGEQAGFFIVSARTAGNDDEMAGLSLFVLPADTAGLELRGYALVDGGRGADLVLDGVRLSDGALIGIEGEAFDAIERTLGHGVLALCAQALGAMEAANARTLDYLRTRKQFGAPIGSNQALQHRMVDLWLGIAQSRSSVINAANALQAGRIERERALSAAKVTLGRVGTRVAEECIQMHGGIGMTWELPLSHLAKGLVMTDHALGDEDYHLARYVKLGRR
ncbi:acyl-CoA dehydrogenase family protein [Cupriavidus sp. 2TAF22]|uniref:acyl-CoA dehydrogenase family protein n=1 Tax=unclassified Cupriavidus TaxID=2640874 RepID=UPI003F8F36F6